MIGVEFPKITFTCYFFASDHLWMFRVCVVLFLLRFFLVFFLSLQTFFWTIFFLRGKLFFRNFLGGEKCVLVIRVESCWTRRLISQETIPYLRALFYPDQPQLYSAECRCACLGDREVATSWRVVAVFGIPVIWWLTREPPVSDFGALEGIGSGSGALVHLSLTSCRSPHSAPAASPTAPLAKSVGEYSWNAYA